MGYIGEPKRRITVTMRISQEDYEKLQMLTEVYETNKSEYLRYLLREEIKREKL